MDALILKAGVDTPMVHFEPSTDTYIMSGKSLPEDVYAFYDPVLAWLDKFEEEVTKEAVFTMKFKYFNTASSKVILDILFKLDEINEEKENIKIDWWYMTEDEDMQEAGEEYADLVDIDFTYQSYARGVEV